MSRGKHYRSGAAVLIGQEPVRGRDAPTISWHQAGEAVFRSRRGQVVSDRALVLQKLGGHDGADGVPPEIFCPGCTAAVAIEAGERFGTARFQLSTEHVAIGHGLSMPSVLAGHDISQRFAPLQPPDVGRDVVDAARIAPADSASYKARCCTDDRGRR